MSSTARASVPTSATAKKYKLVLLGESGVGKSSVVQRLMKNIFNESIHSTVGASFFRYTCPVEEDVVVHFDIWDTAGQERFKSLASMYYRGAAAALVVFDLTAADTYEKAKFWVRELRVNSPETIVMLVGNKSDLDGARQVTAEEGLAGAEEMQAMYVETSARSGEGVPDAFRHVAQRLVEVNCSVNVREGGVVGHTEPSESRRKDNGCC